jgi:hypothetical protein
MCLTEGRRVWVVICDYLAIGVGAGALFDLVRLASSDVGIGCWKVERRRRHRWSQLPAPPPRPPFAARLTAAAICRIYSLP